MDTIEIVMVDRVIRGTFILIDNGKSGRCNDVLNAQYLAKGLDEGGLCVKGQVPDTSLQARCRWTAIVGRIIASISTQSNILRVSLNQPGTSSLAATSPLRNG